VGLGLWVGGFGLWPQPPIPNPQSPIPNPQKYILIKYYFLNNNLKTMTNNIVSSQKKELIYLKIRSALEESKPLVKRTLDHSYLKDFNKVDTLIKNAIKNLEKSIDINNYITIINLTHPTLSNIYIYSKEQWLLYCNFDIIEQCINNKTIKIEYELLDKNVELKKFRKNKRNVIKYIMENIPLKLYTKILLKFLKENESITKKLELFFTQELINENLETYNKIEKKENKLDDVDINLNINNIMTSCDETEESSDIKLQKEKLYPKLDMEYVLHHEDFLKTLEKQLNTFSDNQNKILKIKQLIEEDDKNKIENENNSNQALKTSLKINLENNYSNMSLLEEDNYDNINQRSNVLLTQMNPPPDYVKKLLTDDNFIKKPDKTEYYMGIEYFKDEMNRKIIDTIKMFGKID